MRRSGKGLGLGLLVLAFTCPLSPVPCPIVSAENAPAAKIGFVNVAKIFDGYERTKQSDAVLAKKGQQKEAELESKMSELKKMGENLELLNDAAREAKQRDLQARADEVKRFRTNTAEDLRQERNGVAQEILKDIQQAVDDYAKSKGYTLILDQRAILHGEPAQDVTDDVLQLLNSRFKKS